MCIKGTYRVDRSVSRIIMMGFPSVRNYRNTLQLADDNINITIALHRSWKGYIAIVLVVNT